MTTSNLANLGSPEDTTHPVFVKGMSYGLDRLMLLVKYWVLHVGVGSGFMLAYHFFQFSLSRFF